jgi:hypothetical protein
MQMTNLKKVLMELGNKLVLERGFEPVGDAAISPTIMADLTSDKSTAYITMFTIWLNSNPDARDVLRELGVDWPMPKGGR